MDDGRYLKTALHGITRRGKPKTFWTDSIKEGCGTFGMTRRQGYRTAQVRNNWRTAKNRMFKHCQGINGDN